MASPNKLGSDNDLIVLDGRLSISPEILDSSDTRSKSASSSSSFHTASSPALNKSRSGKTGVMYDRDALDGSIDFCNLPSSPNFEHIHDRVNDGQQRQNHLHHQQTSPQSATATSSSSLFSQNPNASVTDGPARKDYSLPSRRSDFYAFLDNPLTKTVEKLCKITDYVVADKRPVSTRNRDYNYNGYTSYMNMAQQEAIAKDSLADHEDHHHMMTIPPPSLPNIECTKKLLRMPPLTEKQFEEECAHMTKGELLQRIFLSGIEGNELKRKLWPVLLGLHELEDDPATVWLKYEETYNLYKTQWNSITPEQENRFNAFRERKNILQRDVIRCDRNHPFYVDDENIEKIRELLMNYVMHDFDTGYIQGMTDLAAPILYVFNGDLVKSFWCFVQVLEFTKKNFLMQKETIFYQLKMLFKLIQLTDPCFAQYLAENDSANCYFAFRWLICLFKREFVKDRSDDYTKCLIIWEAIWSIHALQKLKESEKKASPNQMEAASFDPNNSSSSQTVKPDQKSTTSLNGAFDSRVGQLSVAEACGGGGDCAATNAQSLNCTVKTEDIEDLHLMDASIIKKMTDASQELPTIDSKHLDNLDAPLPEDQFDSLNSVPNPRLDDVELFCLCLCLSLIRRERDIIMFKKFEGCDILEHFNRLPLADDFESILSHAITIWLWLKEDGEEEKLYEEKIDINADDYLNNSADGFDLLSNDLNPVYTNKFNEF